MITPQGVVSSFGSGLSTPEGVAVDMQGNVYVADNTNNDVVEFNSGGMQINTFSGLSGPVGIALDGQNNLYVANAGSDTLVKISAGGGTPMTLVNGLTGLTGLTIDALGANVYAAFGGNSVLKVSSSGGPTMTVSNSLSSPEGLALDAQGDLFVANMGNGTVSEFSPSETLLNAAYATGLSNPVGLAINSGIPYVASNGDGSINKVLLAGTVVVRSSRESRPMSLGGADNAVAGINLTDAELARIKTGPYGSVVFGDSTQTGDITFKTATPATTAGATVMVLQSTGGSGKIVLDDDAAGTPGIALNGNGGSISLTAGTGGIVAASNTNSIAEIATMAAVTLDTTGGIGSSSTRIQFDGTATPSSVVIGAADQPAGGVFLAGLGALDLGAVTTNNGGLDVTAAGTLTIAGAIASGGGNVSLNAGANAFTDNAAATINAGSGTVTVTADAIAGIGAAVTANGGITLQPQTAGTSIGLNDPNGSFSLTSGELLNLFSTGTVTLGAASAGAISIGGSGALDLSPNGYSLSVKGGAVTFFNPLTVNGSLTLSTGAVINSLTVGLTDVVLTGSSTLQLETSGDVGSSAVPLSTQVSNLGPSATAGNIFINNNGSLTTTGAISPTGSLNITLPAGDFTTHAGNLSAASTVTFSSGGNQKLTSNGQALTNLIHAGTGVLSVADTLSLTGNFSNLDGAGNVDITNRTVNVGGNWSWGNSGSLLSNFSLVVFDGSSQSITGNTSFYSLTKSVSSADTLTFQAGSTQIMAGVLTLKGTSGHLLSLRSSVPGTQWIINPQGFRTVCFLDVQDSFNINANALTPVSSNDSGDNVNWAFASPASPAIMGIHGGSGQSVAVGANYAALSVKSPMLLATRSAACRSRSRRRPWGRAAALGTPTPPRTWKQPTPRALPPRPRRSRPTRRPAASRSSPRRDCCQPRSNLRIHRAPPTNWCS